MKLKAEIWRGPFDQITEVEEELRSSRFFTNRQPEQWNLGPMEVMIPEVDSHKEDGVSSTSQFDSMTKMVSPQGPDAERPARRDAFKCPEEEGRAGPFSESNRQIDQAVDSERQTGQQDVPLLRRRSTHYPEFDIMIDEENIKAAANSRGMSLPPEKTNAWQALSAKEEESGIGFTFSKSKRLNPFDSANQLSAEKSMKDLSAINAALSQVASAGNLLDDKWFAAQVGFQEDRRVRQEPPASRHKEDRSRDLSRRGSRSFLLQQTVKKDSSMLRSIFKNIGESSRTKRIPERNSGKIAANQSNPLLKERRKAPWEGFGGLGNRQN